MAQFDIPRQQPKSTKVLGNFLGVDYTSIMPNERRATELKNLVNNNGYYESRPGYAQVGNTFTTGGQTPVALKINGVWNIDVHDDNLFIVHAGTKLWLVDDTFTNPVELISGMTDAISQGFYLNNRLIILDGTRAVAYSKIGGSWSAAFLDTIGYIPTTSISRNPDGTGAVTNEPINNLSAAQINSFYPNGTSTVYQLSDTGLDATTPVVTQLNSQGTYDTITAFTYDKTAGTVTFNVAPVVSPVDGRDSIFIRFYKTNTAAISNINKSTIGALFGYDGNNNRLFVSGNSDYPNLDWYSKEDDPTYFPNDNYTVIGGSEPILAYLVLNDGTMGVQKRLSDTDFTIYYRKSVMYNSQEIFPIEEGVKTIGCISKYANSNLLNDTLTLCDEGVFGITSGNYKYRFANERSYFIKNRLLAESNLQNATSIVHDGKYYLAVNNHVYVADSRYRSKVDESNSDFQYEWYYWDNIPVRVWFRYDGDLYFGTVDGKIVKFNDTALDYTTPINSRWESAYLDYGSITVAKTIKDITVISKPLTNTNFTLGYITEDGDSEIVTKDYQTLNYPRTLQEKEKIKKFMFIKFYIENNTRDKMNFYQLATQFVYSGKYRGD